VAVVAALAIHQVILVVLAVAQEKARALLFLVEQKHLGKVMLAEVHPETIPRAQGVAEQVPLAAQVQRK